MNNILSGISNPPVRFCKTCGSQMVKTEFKIISTEYDSGSGVLVYYVMQVYECSLKPYTNCLNYFFGGRNASHIGENLFCDSKTKIWH